jgi:thiosulfate/3-mercaptopyruvate sulfurtransferase
VSIYWEDILDPATKTFRSADELRAIYAQHGVKPTDDVIAYCWVGHRSAVDLFVLHLIGHGRLRNYLGSWEEWSKRLDLPTTPFKK